MKSCSACCPPACSNIDGMLTELHRSASKGQAARARNLTRRPARISSRLAVSPQPGGAVSRLYKPKAGFWIRLCVTIIYPLDALLFRIRWRNLDRIPAQGGVIIVLNHVSHLDTLLMARMVWQSGRVPRFLVKNTLYDVAE